MRAPARALALALLVAGGCSAGAGSGARSGEPNGSRASQDGAPLFARLGGMDGIRALVDELAARLAADSRVQELFSDTDFRRFKSRLVVQLCALTGGPCRDSRRELNQVHARHQIRPGHLDAFLDDVAAAMTAVGTGARERAELLEHLRALGRELVEPGRPDAR